MTNKPIIRVQNLSVKYDKHIILDDISFDIKEGEIFVILGQSGCGKTTLLHHMIGLLQPKNGQIFIKDKNITTEFETERADILKRIGVTFQGGALFSSMNLLENVRLPLEEWTTLPPDAMNAIAQNKLELVGLGDFITHMPAELSGGMQKRAAIARAMALDPDILFFDEPSSGLDPITAAQLDQLILKLSKALKNTFVIVSHELSSIYNIAQRAIMLHKGEIIAEGKPKDLCDSHDNEIVRKFFHREP